MMLSPLSRCLRGALTTATALLWPPCCVGCDAALPEPGDYFCEECAGRAKRIEPPFCSVCSRPFVDDGAPALGSDAGRCSDCRERGSEFECAVSFCRHDDLARDLIARFKYRGQTFLRRPLGAWLVETVRTDARLRSRPIDALVPVPLHRRRERERGFNQANALCHGIRHGTGLPVWRALRRVRATAVQARLTGAERPRNVHGAFAVAGKWPVTGAHLLLVDDVFTTGSTVHECARVLRQAGAASVRVLTVARRC